MKKETTLDAIARGPQVDRWLAAAVIAFAAATTAGCSTDVTDEEEGGTSADAVRDGNGCIDVESSDVSLKDAPSGGFTRDEGRASDRREDVPSGGITRCREKPAPSGGYDDAPSGGAPPPTREPRGDAPSGGWW